MRKTKHQIAVNHAPQVEFAAEIGQVLNLAGQRAVDPWREAVTHAQRECDRARAEAMQVDMFPDIYDPSGSGKGEEKA